MTSTTEPSGWLIDKSALVRLGRSPDSEAWADRIERGLVRDLLIAAIAERAGLVVLHQDRDFDLIAEITGQSTERLNG